MAASQEPNASINYGWALGESGWNVGADENWKKIGSLLFLSVISATTSASPGTPASGDRYIVGSSASGDWTGQEGNVAVWDGDSSAWVFYVPVEGWTARAEDSEQPYLYTGSSWSLEGATYGQYADDTAAATGSVPIGGYYVNSTTGALSVRLA